MPSSRSLAKKHLLVIDDDPSVHDFVAHALRAHRVRLTNCDTASDALDLIAKRHFDLLLLDLGLPDMNGLELLSRLKRVGSGSRVIVITADTTTDSLLRAIRENTYDYLCKPFTTRELEDAVVRALGNASEPMIEVLSARREWLELAIPCSRDSAERIEHFVRQLGADLDLDLMEPVALAFHELLMNAVEWGGKLDPSHRVRISCLRTPRMLLYRISDPGPGFGFEGLIHSALVNPDGAVGSNIVREQLGIRAGGLGLTIVKAIADDLLYNEAQNEVVLVKYLTCR